jgi:hypothetical protein
MRLLLISVFLVFSLATKLVYAQVDPTPKSDTMADVNGEESEVEAGQLSLPEQGAEEDQVDSTAAEKAAEKKEPELSSKAEPTREVFKPSEEISEDRPVPFPVDI